MNLLLDDPAFKQVCVDTLSKWGESAQKRVAVEECSEFITEYAREGRNRSSKEKMIDEITDVIIMMNQMAHLYGEKEVKERLLVKIQKIKSRLDNE